MRDYGLPSINLILSEHFQWLCEKEMNIHLLVLVQK